MQATPYDHFTYEYEEQKPLFTTVLDDPAFIAFEPNAHRAHLELYQRDYSFYFHNSRLEKWAKAFRTPLTRRRMWHVRTDAYLAHLVQNGLVHAGNRDAYADMLDFIRHQNKHLASLCRTLLSDIYRGPKPKPENVKRHQVNNVVAFRNNQSKQNAS